MLFGVLVLFGLPSAGNALRVVTVVVAVAGVALPMMAMAKHWPRARQWVIALVLIAAEFSVITAIGLT